MKGYHKKGNYIIKVENKNTRDKIIIKAGLLIFMSILIVVLIIGITLNLIKAQSKRKIQEEYKAQIILAEQQKKEEERKAKEEAEKKRQEKIPKLTEKGRENMASIYRSDKKRVFLTFDDGPSTITPQILDTLKQNKVPATFFVLGSRVDVMPETTKRIYEEGHYIANHGYSHVYSSIYSSPEAVLNEYNQCNDAVKRAIGVPEYNSHLFRFPGGFPGGPYVDIKTQAKEVLSKNDILYVDWNALTGDAETSKPTPEYEMQRLQQTIGNKSSAIILMHDAQAKKVTADTLPQIITYLREQGYEFKNFYDIIK